MTTSFSKPATRPVQGEEDLGHAARGEAAEEGVLAELPRQRLAGEAPCGGAVFRHASRVHARRDPIATYCDRHAGRPGRRPSCHGSTRGTVRLPASRVTRAPLTTGRRRRSSPCRWSASAPAPRGFGSRGAAVESPRIAAMARRARRPGVRRIGCVALARRSVAPRAALAAAFVKGPYLQALGATGVTVKVELAAAAPARVEVYARRRSASPVASVVERRRARASTRCASSGLRAGHRRTSTSSTAGGATQRARPLHHGAGRRAALPLPGLRRQPLRRRGPRRRRPRDARPRPPTSSSTPATWC